MAKRATVKNTTVKNGVRPYQGRDGLWYWRITRSGRVRGDGSEGYASRGNAMRAWKGLVTWIKSGALD